MNACRGNVLFLTALFLGALGLGIAGSAPMARGQTSITYVYDTTNLAHGVLSSRICCQNHFEGLTWINNGWSLPWWLQTPTT
jgi:hypothetical protein